MAQQVSKKETQTCGYGGCRCTSDQYQGLTRDDQWYCAEGCAQGKGCEHVGCECSSVSAGDSGKGPGASIPGATTKPVPKQNPGHTADHNPGQGTPATRRMP